MKNIGKMKYTKGNILDSESEAIVNPVNTVGVMGKGLALQFKQAYPKNYKIYREVCEKKALKVGRLLLIDESNLERSKFIINFPTKTHYAYPSKIEYIELGLKNLVELIEETNLKSIAIPALGCGLGGLKWEEVNALFVKYLSSLENIEITIYEPK